VRIDCIGNPVEEDTEIPLKWIAYLESNLFILLNSIAELKFVREARALTQSFSNSTYEYKDLGLLYDELLRFSFINTYFIGILFEDPLPTNFSYALQLPI